MLQDEIVQVSKSESLATRAVTAAPPAEVLEVTVEDVPDLLRYWHVILKRRWEVLSCVLIVFSTVAIGTFKQKPLYAGRVLVEINPEQPNVVNFREVLQVDSKYFDTYMETQYNVLQSRTLAGRVIDDLKLYLFPEFYRARRLGGLIESDPEKIPSASDPAPPNPSADAYRNSLRNFLDAVSVSPVRRSNLVEISFLSRDPQLAARVANQLASAYIDQNLQVKWDETLKASEWLSGQLGGLKAKLEKSEDNLQAYARANSILFVEEKQNLTNERLKQLQEAYTKAQADRYYRESLYNLVRDGRVNELPGSLNNKLIQDLSLRLAELQRDYAELTTTVKPEYPKAAALQRQIDTIQAELNRQLSNIAGEVTEHYRSAVDNENLLAQALEQQKAEVNDIAERSIQYNILKREVDTNRQLYDGLLQRLKEAQVSAGLKASNIRVVDAAEVPKGPVKPRVLLNLSLGLFLGLGLGIGLGFLQEYLDKTVKNSDDVETLLRLPALGMVPEFVLNGAGKSPEDEKLSVISESPLEQHCGVIQFDPSSLEAFRSLRTSILLSASPVPKIILITSSLPGEGKTTTTVNLGAALASLGSRVVIVDCDMRRPACHRAVGVPNSPGFVQSLTTGHVDLDKVILPVPGLANLSVIPCGPIPPNPAEVLSSVATGETLRRLRAGFEYVLVDSPPLLSVADSRILSTIVDATVLVVRAHSTPYDIVRRARALLASAGARILGVALNGVDLGRDGYSHGYYQYGYGYGDETEGSGDTQEPREREVRI